MNRADIYRAIKHFSDKIGVRNFLRSTAYFIEDLFDKNILAKNKSLENIHQGKKCFIFGNGVSVNNIDLSLLYDEYTFGTTLIHQHKDFHKLNLNCFVVSAGAWLIRSAQLKSLYAKNYIYHEADINGWLQTEKNIIRFCIDPNVFFRETDAVLSPTSLIFLNAHSKKFVEKNNIFTNKEVFYFKPLKPILSADSQVIDLSKRITLLDGSIYAMIAIAMYMGFKEIYFVGNDYTLQPPLQFHFYNTPYFSKKLPKDTAMKLIYQIAKARGQEVYKIEEDGEFYKPMYVKYNKIPDEHSIVKKFAESIGVKMCNIVPQGFESPVYEKLSWEEVVSKVLTNN